MAGRRTKKAAQPAAAAEEPVKPAEPAEASEPAEAPESAEAAEAGEASESAEPAEPVFANRAERRAHARGKSLPQPQANGKVIHGQRGPVQAPRSWANRRSG